MSEKTQKIRTDTFNWLQDRYEQDVLVLVNNPESFCDAEIRDEMDEEIRNHYRILKGIGEDINFTFWAVIESFLEKDDPKSVERVERFKKIVLPGANGDVSKGGISGYPS